MSRKDESMNDWLYRHFNNIKSENWFLGIVLMVVIVSAFIEYWISPTT